MPVFSANAFGLFLFESVLLVLKYGNGTDAVGKSVHRAQAQPTMANGVCTLYLIFPPAVVCPKCRCMTAVVGGKIS